MYQRVRELAKKTRREIDEAGLSIEDYERIATKYDIRFGLSSVKEGVYSNSNGKRAISLSRGVTRSERRNFTFCHELMHDRIECDDDLCEMIHEFTIHMSDKNAQDLKERLCNVGAAEILIPSQAVRELVKKRDFSTTLIPELCDRFAASSIAVAYQMIDCTSHECYLVIATPEMQYADSRQPRLVITHTGASPAAKYSIKRNQVLENNSVLYETLQKRHVTGKDKLPFASGRGWPVPCDALYYHSQVIAFFNCDSPINKRQRSFFDD